MPSDPEPRVQLQGIFSYNACRSLRAKSFALKLDDWNPPFLQVVSPCAANEKGKETGVPCELQGQRRKVA